MTEPDEFVLGEQEGRQWVEEHRQSERELLIVAEVGPVIVGVVSFSCNERRRLSHWGTLGISIHRDYRNRGIGKALMVTLVEWARGVTGLEKITLEVAADNVRAVHLYYGLGFELEGNRVRGIRRGSDDYVDSLIMSLTVGQL